MRTEAGFLVLESGEIFPGLWQGEDRGLERAGEVVFNTSHSGYEEMASDPSYFNQILVLTAPQQGNYGVHPDFRESRRLWIEGMVCVEMQSSPRDRSWCDQLLEQKIPILTGVDTRRLVLKLRDSGTVWGALVRGANEDQVRERARTLIRDKQKSDKDWAHAVSVREPQILQGALRDGPRIAALDFGCKTNSMRELMARSCEVKLFPSRARPEEIRVYNPDGVFLSNGPGDPADVVQAAETVKALLGWKPIFGICMGHQILGRAMGGETYKLKFGHRGSNHPIKDKLLNKIYMTSQNHGYAVKPDTLPKTTTVTHINLNDHTVAGIYDSERRAMSVQFHPESHPGPHEATELFDFFIRLTR